MNRPPAHSLCSGELPHSANRPHLALPEPVEPIHRNIFLQVIYGVQYLLSIFMLVMSSVCSSLDCQCQPRRLVRGSLCASCAVGERGFLVCLKDEIFDSFVLCCLISSVHRAPQPLHTPYAVLPSARLLRHIRLAKKTFACCKLIFLRQARLPIGREDSRVLPPAGGRGRRQPGGDHDRAGESVACC